MAGLEKIVTDGLCTYSAATQKLSCIHQEEVGRRPDIRVETSHLPFRRREREMLRFQ